MQTTSLTKSKAVWALILALLVLGATSLHALAQDSRLTITWEEDSSGDPLLAGQIIDDEFQSATEVGFTVSADSLTGVAAIFDSSAPTGGDSDLGSPNETCSPAGPGVGAGGEVGSPGENCEPQNNVLVIVDNTADGNSDGLIDDPGDDESGGVVTILFDEPVALDFADVIDQESGSPVTVSLYGDAAGADLIATMTASGFGENSYERLLLWELNVRRVDFEFEAGGAIGDVGYKPLDPTAVTLSSMGATDGTPLTMASSLGPIVLALVFSLGAISWFAIRRRAV